MGELDKVYEFGLNLPATIATFRAGCILQGYLLKPMGKAFEEDPNLSSLLVAFAKEINENVPRAKCLMAKLFTETTAVFPVMCASISYLQTMVTTNLPSAQTVALPRRFRASRIQALRQGGRLQCTMA